MEKEFYREIQERVLKPILNDISTRRGELTKLARMLESKYFMRHAKNRLSELRSGNRELSFFYLNILLKGGVMTVEQILRGRKIEELNDTEREIVLRLSTDSEILQLIYEGQRDGIDVKQLLKISLKRS
jgi:hypothetical protein